MKKFVLAATTAAFVFTTGCSAIRDELRYPSGASGRLLDERTFDTSESKQLTLLRAHLALAIAAQIGSSTVATEDADAFARQLADAANELNYAAVDAGYPYFHKNDDDRYEVRVPCTIDKLGATNRSGDTKTTGWLDEQKAEDESYANNKTFVENPYIQQDAKCAGFFVNFEANIARIESRIVRAILTSLPSDRAREFLEDLTSGNLLGALWSLARTVGDIANAFHRGAGVYRAGLENVTATTIACDWDDSYSGDRGDYRQDLDTVLKASACLGLSLDSLFDDDDIEANKLADEVPPEAFMALARISRTACVSLPILTSATSNTRNEEDREARASLCRVVRFNPKSRPDQIELTSDTPTGKAEPKPGEATVEEEEAPLPNLGAPADDR